MSFFFNNNETKTWMHHFLQCTISNNVQRISDNWKSILFNMLSTSSCVHTNEQQVMLQHSSAWIECWKNSPRLQKLLNSIMNYNYVLNDLKMSCDCIMWLTVWLHLLDQYFWVFLLKFNLLSFDVDNIFSLLVTVTIMARFLW